VALLRIAVAQNRIVVTHDSDFGTLAIHQREPLVGILYLRPAHVDPQFTISTIDAVLQADRDLVPPFLLVAKRTENRVRIRMRALSP
jgi:predicted nuclease of predicted toxin-antitoxin system